MYNIFSVKCLYTLSLLPFRAHNFIFTWELRRPRLRGVKWLSQIHTAVKAKARIWISLFWHQHQFFPKHFFSFFTFQAYFLFLFYQASQHHSNLMKAPFPLLDAISETDFLGWFLGNSSHYKMVPVHMCIHKWPRSEYFDCLCVTTVEGTLMWQDSFLCHKYPSALGLCSPNRLLRFRVYSFFPAQRAIVRYLLCASVSAWCSVCTLFHLHKNPLRYGWRRRWWWYSRFTDWETKPWSLQSWNLFWL